MLDFLHLWRQCQPTLCDVNLHHIKARVLLTAILIKICARRRNGALAFFVGHRPRRRAVCIAIGTVRAPGLDLYKYNVGFVLHDQVDLISTRAEILLNKAVSLLFQIIRRSLLSVPPQFGGGELGILVTSDHITRPETD